MAVWWPGMPGPIAVLAESEADRLHAGEFRRPPPKWQLDHLGLTHAMAAAAAM